MTIGESGTDSGVDDHLESKHSSVDPSLDSHAANDSDALLAGHASDPHLKQQLAQSDQLDLDNIDDANTREGTPHTPGSNQSSGRNPSAPESHHNAITTPNHANPPDSGVNSHMATPIMDSTRSSGLSHSNRASRQSSEVPVGDQTHIIEDIGSHKASREHSVLDMKPSESNALVPTGGFNADQTAKMDSSAPPDSMPPSMGNNDDNVNRVSAYARLDFDSFTFYVQTSQVLLGRKAEIGGETADVDVHLGPAKAISRRHAKIFYNFATQRFESTVIGRNGAFVGDVFVETGSTVPLRDSTKVQIHQIAFTFVSPMQGKVNGDDDDVQADNVRNNNNTRSGSPAQIENGSEASHHTPSSVSGANGRKQSLKKIESATTAATATSATAGGANKSKTAAPKLEHPAIDDAIDHKINSSRSQSVADIKPMPDPTSTQTSRTHTPMANPLGPDLPNSNATNHRFDGIHNSHSSTRANSVSSLGSGHHSNSNTDHAFSMNHTDDCSIGANIASHVAGALDKNGDVGAAHSNVHSHPDHAQHPVSLADTLHKSLETRRQSSSRHDENNLFAHVPADQLAQVDAAIAGLPDIPGFDTPNLSGTNGPMGPQPETGGKDKPGILGAGNDLNLQQFLGLQSALHGGNTGNMHISDESSNLLGGGFHQTGNQNGNNAGANAAAANLGGLGLQNSQNLQALQAFQGLEGIAGLQGIPNLQGLQGLQPAAGLGLLQQLQALQRGNGQQNAQFGLHNTQQLGNEGTGAGSVQSSQPRQKRKPKREYRPEEIPEPYRNKPAHSYSHLITAALRERSSRSPNGNQAGSSLGDIYEAIMDLFPYYRYCPAGWQNSVRHNLSSSKSFRKVSKEGKGWLWGSDEEYLAEKEKQRQKALQRQQQQASAQQQAMAEQHAREQAREQARSLQQQRDREREMEQRRMSAERAARAAQVGVPLHQLTATLGANNLPSTFGHMSGNAGMQKPGLSTSPSMNSPSMHSQSISRPSSAASQPESMQSKPSILPAETVKSLAGLQQHVQQELAKEGQPPSNPQLLSNALAVVIAQTAKHAGGLQSLGTVLQQPGAVQKSLNQALQLLRSTQRVPPATPSATTTPNTPETVSTQISATHHTQQPQQQQPYRQTSIPTPSASAPSPHISQQTQPVGQKQRESSFSQQYAGSSYSAAQMNAQPKVDAQAVVEANKPADPATMQAQPHVAHPANAAAEPQAAQPAAAKTEEKPVEGDCPVADEKKSETQKEKSSSPSSVEKGGSSGESTEKTNDTNVKPAAKEASSSAAPNTNSTGTSSTPSTTSGASSSSGATHAASGTKKPEKPAKKQPSLEKITEILTKAEAMPNPTPEIKGMIEKLKQHKRQSELKRSAEQAQKQSEADGAADTAASSPVALPPQKRQAIDPQAP